MEWKARAATFGVMAGLVMAIATDRAAAYTEEQQAACTDDAMRLCGNFVPDVDQITACMIRSKAQLTPRCAVYFQPSPPPAFAKKAGRSPAKPKNAGSATTARAKATKASAPKAAQSASR